MTCQPKDKLKHSEYKNKKFIQAKTQEDRILAPTLYSNLIREDKISTERTQYSARELLELY